MFTFINIDILSTV